MNLTCLKFTQLNRIKQTSRTAILFFARSAQVEAMHKPLGQRVDRAREIHTYLQQQTLALLDQSGLPVVHSTEADQYGDTFGDRLANAIQTCWSDNIDQLIIVGGDSPELDLKDIRKAVVELDSGNNVIGADFRGGSFLIGLIKSSFRKTEFAQLPWKTSRLAAALQRELQLANSGTPGSVVQLIKRADCNTAHDLASIATRTGVSVLHQALNSCRDLGQPATIPALFAVSDFGDSLGLRGPPIVSVPTAA